MVIALSNRYKWVASLTFILFFSCGNTKENPLDNPTQLTKYFPLSQFIEDQIQLLDGREVSKLISIKDRKESFTQVLDAEGWRKELDLFIQTDINKNSLAASYSTEDSPGLLRHTLIPGENGDVTNLEVHRSGKKIDRIDFTFKKENLFYLSEGSGSLLMTADGTQISSYEVNGFQKVWFLPANVMATSGEIR